MTKGSARAGNNICLCATQVQWFQKGFGHQYRVHQLTSMDEMFPSHGMHDNPSEFFLMDVILNRRMVPPQNDNVTEPDPDSVVMVQAYGDGRSCGWTSNIEDWSHFSPVLESFTVHVSDVGRMWVATRPTYSLMQVGFGFKRMLW